MRSLYEPQVSLVAKVMDMQLERQNVIMSNIANVNTPQYKTRNLEFEDQLQKALNLDARGKLSRTEQGHIPSVFNADTFHTELGKSIKPRVAFGEDRVNLDKEMVKMAKASLQYNALTQIIKNDFDIVKTAISEGSKA